MDAQGQNQGNIGMGQKSQYHRGQGSQGKLQLFFMHESASCMSFAKRFS